MSARRRKWAHKPVSSMAEINPRTVLPATSDTLQVPLYEMAAIDELFGRLKAPQWVPLESNRSGRSRFQNGDVLFAKITPCVQNGKSALVADIPGNLGLGSSEFYVLRPKHGLHPEYLFYFIRQQTVVKAAVGSFTGSSGRQRVPRNFWDTLDVPFPPVPVQERIVQILQKAEAIRRKRQEVQSSIERILILTFLETFGNPITNAHGLPRCRLGDLCTPMSGGTPSKKNSAFWTNGTVPWVSPEDMKVAVISDVPDKVTEEALGNRRKAMPGTVLVVVRGMILCHSAPVCLIGSPLTFNQDIKALIPKEGVPGEFLLWALRCSRDRLLRLVDTASHGTKKIDTDRLLDLELFRASPTVMNHFATVHQKYFEDADSRNRAYDGASSLCRALLSRAFSGELTAEWEAANAEWIAAQVELHQRLPQLLLLALIRERAQRVDGEASQAPVLVTALMKYAFLTQMEGSGRRRFYQFVPYHYGPFAKELYADLEKLQNDGLISVDNGDEDKTRITLVQPAKADEVLNDLPEDLQDDLTAVLDAYGDLDHNALLDAVYAKYPAYAKKSLRGTRTAKAARAKKPAKKAPRTRRAKS